MRAFTPSMRGASAIRCSRSSDDFVLVAGTVSGGGAGTIRNSYIATHSGRVTLVLVGLARGERGTSAVTELVTSAGLVLALLTNLVGFADTVR